MEQRTKRKIELLAPAKDLEHGRAALWSGADALYVGAPRFGARAAAGVSLEEIEALCTEAHSFGARVYVAMNTLLYEEELADAEQLVHALWGVGADALIVQDMAFLRMNLPPIELHASTQTCNFDPQRIAFLGHAGFTRVILERALSLSEIEQIHAESEVELEAFVHGAICVSYSGRCYMSRATSSRSGNRGACSQPCRLPYNLLDERMQPLQKNKHFLSVQDMNLSESLPDMIRAGVTSFKIEGRLKEIGYVKNVVAWYRNRLDAIIATDPSLIRASQGVTRLDFDPQPQKSFARGATTYFMADKRNTVASFDTPKSVGERLGRVQQVGNDYFTLERVQPLANGDGICFFTDDQEFTGTNINRAEGTKIYPNRMDGITRGMELYRNYDHLFTQALARSKVRRVVETTARLEWTPTSVILEVSDGTLQAQAFLEGSFEGARQRERAVETLQTQLAKSGDTIYTVREVSLPEGELPFVPMGQLNELRRDALTQLTALRITSHTRGERRAEDRTATFPVNEVGARENVTNTLSEIFYRDHGVANIARGADLLNDYEGRTLMQMRYCLRRELGECLKEDHSLRGKLYLEHGLRVYELQFDCAACEMRVIDRGTREKIG